MINQVVDNILLNQFKNEHCWICGFKNDSFLDKVNELTTLKTAGS